MAAFHGEALDVSIHTDPVKAVRFFSPPKIHFSDLQKCRLSKQAVGRLASMPGPIALLHIELSSP